MYWQPNLSPTQRWLRALTGTACLVATFSLPQLSAGWRIALAGLGILSLIQALAGF